MTNKVIVDIETMTSPWQKDLVTGFKKGEMMVISSGRQAGKSQIVAYQRLWEAVMNGTRQVQDLKLSEGTVYGARYYTVEPVGGNWLEMETWCMDTFGAPGDKIWDSGPAPLPAKRWYMNNRKFWFRTEKDRDWFILRWRS